MDTRQLQKFIQKIFPSKAGKERLDQLDKIDKMMKKKEKKEKKEKKDKKCKKSKRDKSNKKGKKDKIPKDLIKKIKNKMVTNESKTKSEKDKVAEEERSSSEEENDITHNEYIQIKENNWPDYETITSDADLPDRITNAINTRLVDDGPAQAGNKRILIRLYNTKNVDSKPVDLEQCYRWFEHRQKSL